MKVLQIICFLSVVFVSNVLSQDNPFVVDVAPRITNGDTQISFVALIPDANLSSTEAKWLKYIAKGSRGKATFINGIYLQTGALNPEVSLKPFDVNSKLTNKNSGVQLSVWIDQNGMPFRGDGTKNNGDLAVQNYVREFAVKEYRAILNNQLIEAQKNLRILESDYAQLRKNNLSKTNKLQVVDSNAYATTDSKLDTRNSKKGKHNKKGVLAEGDTDRMQEQLAYKSVEIESQKKTISDTKVKLVEIR